MQLKFDDTKIEIDGSILVGLEQYAKNVMKKMQEAEPDFADCWTACLITFDGIQPQFMWGDFDDMETEGGIYVELPITQ